MSEYVGIIEELRKEVTELKAKLQEKEFTNKNNSNIEYQFELLKQLAIEQFSLLSGK